MITKELLLEYKENSKSLWYFMLEFSSKSYLINVQG